MSIVKGYALVIAFILFCSACGGGAKVTPTISVTGAKLVRLDGTELELSAQPIPRKISIKFTFSEAVDSETDRDQVEAALQLFDSDDNAVAGSFTWAADFTSVTFTPTRRLEYQTQ